MTPFARLAHWLVESKRACADCGVTLTADQDRFCSDHCADTHADEHAW